MALTYVGMEAGIVGTQSELLGYSGFISSTAGTNPPLTREQLDHAARCIQSVVTRACQLPFVHELTVRSPDNCPVALMGCNDRCPAEASVSSASRIVRLLPSLVFDTISDLMAFLHLGYGTGGVVSTLFGAPVNSLRR
jgi:hypothetical protein